MMGVPQGVLTETEPQGELPFLSECRELPDHLLNHAGEFNSLNPQPQPFGVVAVDLQQGLDLAECAALAPLDRGQCALQHRAIGALAGAGQTAQGGDRAQDRCLEVVRQGGDEIMAQVFNGKLALKFQSLTLQALDVQALAGGEHQGDADQQPVGEHQAAEGSDIRDQQIGEGEAAGQRRVAAELRRPSGFVEHDQRHHIEIGEHHLHGREGVHQGHHGCQRAHLTAR